ncbi:hypothetical protein R9X47_28770 [Wukongibacter baidiensis]|uniref:hypothetical protein n=1 Tax=Wukongibacter baidiensis TaxID=1723361 RepID=UPI003D7FCD16
MNRVIAKILNHIKKQLWLIIISLLIILILPSRKIINEDFRVYNYSNGIEENRTINLNIDITKHNKIPFISNKHDILLEVNGRKYRYVASNYSGRNASYVPFSSNIFEFGVLLPNEDFSEFAILFDEKHHFDVSDELKFVVYPQRNESESLKLLKELLDYNNYDTEQRPMY